MDVSSIVEQLLFSTVRVEVRTPAGTSTGTAFAFDYAYEDVHYPFLVTNKHVVKDASSGSFFFTLLQNDKPAVGQRLTVEYDGFASAWFGHPDPNVDIAVMPLAPIMDAIQNQGSAVFFRTIPSALIPDRAALDQLDALEELVFIGYPNGIYDEVNLLPITRRGTSATPISLDYCGKPQFLIDASVFPGSSGSPVFVYNAGSYFVKNLGTRIGGRLLFVGVIAQVLLQPDIGGIKFVSVPTQQMPMVVLRQLLDLGVAFKSSTVVETVEALLRHTKVIQ